MKRRVGWLIVLLLAVGAIVAGLRGAVWPAITLSLWACLAAGIGLLLAPRRANQSRRT